MGLIESYNIEKDGFQPVIIRDGWQVAKLNYCAENHIDNIVNLTKHKKSDKVISLLAGNTMLIATDNPSLDLQIVPMKRGTSYNIPKGVWYAIAMNVGSQLLVVENSNTHLEDLVESHLSEIQRQRIRQRNN